MVKEIALNGGSVCIGPDLWRFFQSGLLKAEIIPEEVSQRMVLYGSSTKINAGGDSTVNEAQVREFMRAMVPLGSETQVSHLRLGFASIRFHCSDQDIGAMVKKLLAPHARTKHIQERAHVNSLKVSIQPSALPDLDWSRSISGRFQDWSFSIDSRKAFFIREDEAHILLSPHNTFKSSESFFYKCLRPFLFELLAFCGYVCVHGSAILHKSLGSVIFIGPRFHGKSSLALSFVARGHKLIADDLILFRRDGRAGIETVVRAMHVDPELANLIEQQHWFDGVNEYMPGTGRVEIHPSLAFPEQHVRYAPQPRILVFPDIKIHGPSQIREFREVDARHPIDRRVLSRIRHTLPC